MDAVCVKKVTKKPLTTAAELGNCLLQQTESNGERLDRVVTEG
jgi:hypothetical protein